MRRSILFLLAFCLITTPVLAGRPILLVTPQGVYQAEVVNGVPGPWKPMEMDVIVQGFNPGAPVPPGEDPPTTPPADPIVAKISELAKSGLQDKDEATAVSAMVDSLSKLGLSGSRLKEALEMAAPIADTSMQAGGRINRFVKAALAVTVDAAKLKAGIAAAWNVSQATLNMIHETAQAKPQVGDDLPAEALDFMTIIQLIQTIIQLLQNLGLI